MIWITGNSGSGKTTLAKWIVAHCFKDEVAWLDGDEMRKLWPDLKWSREDRIENNLRIARLAKLLSDQGLVVVVSTICPYADLRNQIREMVFGNVQFVYLSGGKEPSEQYPYEERRSDER